MRRHSNAAVSGLSSINITDFSFGQIGKKGEIVFLTVNYAAVSGLSSINITDFSFGQIGKKGEIVFLTVNYVLVLKEMAC